ncbi:MAG: Xaa-Pro peptidase family protein [Nitrospinota bacterium]|nr:Xaa-Pro peptidase family protein [Nitrospinota bacterium]
MSFSTKERDRRHANLRADMESENLDILVVYGNSGRQGPRTGNLAYVSNFRSFSGQQVLVFPLKGEPILFVGVENQRIEANRGGWIEDVRCEAMTPVPTQTSDYLKEISDSGKRIGISTLSIIPFNWFQQFQGRIPAKEWVDAGDMVWKPRLVQSAEEIEMSRHAALLGDRIWDRIREFACEGVTELDIRAEMDKVIIPEGGTENFNMMGLASMAGGGEAPWGYVIPQTKRAMKNGDALLLEISPRVEGYWNQLVRVLCLGPAEQWLIDAHDVVRAARDASLEYLKPGEPMVGLASAMDDVFKAKGFEVWPFGLVHITGLDLTDYMITPKSTGTIEPGMVITVHPMYQLGPDRQIFWGESYLVTDSGFELLNRCSDELACL